MKSWYHSKNWTLFRYTVLIVIIFGLVFMAVFVLSLGSGKERVLQDLRNISLVDAIKWLQENELRPVVYETLDENVTEFFVISQRPEPGIRVKQGRAVTLVVSSGNKKNTMPNFIAMPLDEVQKQVFSLFSGSRLPKVVKLERFSIEYDKGLVIDHSPRPGERIDPDKQIALVVSSGLVSDTLETEDYQLQNYISVSNVLAKKGIRSTARYLPTGRAANVGRIFEQSVEPGRLLIPGDKIDFSVGVKQDTFVESQSTKTIEKLRTIRFRVPYLSTSTNKILEAKFTQEELRKLFDNRLESDRAQVDGKICNCIEDLSKEEIENYLNPSEQEVIKAPADEMAPPPEELFSFREVEVIIEDERGMQPIFLEETPAGLELNLPYRSLGPGSISIYIDSVFYKSEGF